MTKAERKKIVYVVTPPNTFVRVFETAKEAAEYIRKDKKLNKSLEPLISHKFTL